jgi:CRP-like cAMP-binding protein
MDAAPIASNPPSTTTAFHAASGSALGVRYFANRVRASEKLVKKLKASLSEALMQHRVNVSILNDLKSNER